MSTDTDYIITIKSRNAILRNAASDFIELALSPWRPERENMKTLTRLYVFRNESNCHKLMQPPALCEEAANMFPNVKTSFSSENEYGYTADDEWLYQGDGPDNIADTIALRVLEIVDTHVSDQREREKWLTPLALWSARNNLSDETRKSVLKALEKAEAAKNAEIDKYNAGAAVKFIQHTRAAQELEERLRWNFHIVLAAESRRVGWIGEQSFWFIESGGSLNGGEWDRNLRKCESDDIKSLFELAGDYGSVAIMFPITPQGRDASRLLHEQSYAMLGRSSERVFTRTKQGVRQVATEIQCVAGELFWMFGEVQNSNPDTREAHSKLQTLCSLARLVDPEESLWCITEDDNPRGACGLDRHAPLALGPEHVYVAMKNIFRRAPRGRILSLALADGHIVWESETVFDDCEALVLPDATSILAITRSGRASTELIRVDSTTGKQLWRVALERTESRFPRLVSTAQTAVVLILTEEDKSKISWWDIATGKPVAEATSDSILDYLCIDSNRVYLCGDDRAQAFRLDGQLVWSVALPAAAGFCHGMCIGPGGVLLLSFAEQGALAINCDDGSSIWHIRDHCINQVYVLGPEEVVIGPGDVGFFASGEKCIARNLLDGSLRWELGVGPDNSIRSLAVTESAVVIGTSSGRLLLADIASGEQIGSIGLDMMVGTRLVLAADGSLCCIAAPTAWPNHESFLFCVDLGQGKPAGPWPMAGQSRSGAAFLHTEKTETYGKFAFSSVQVGKI